MTKLFITNFICCFLWSAAAWAQAIDSTLENLKEIPAKYIKAIDGKIKLYTNRITSKTEKTLTKLGRWETKIHSLLQKVSPETADRLFGNNQTTFSSLLQQIKQGQAIALLYQARYDKYHDDVTTSLNYLAQQKEQLDSGLIKKIKVTSSKMKELAEEEDKNEALQQFIKQRKKQLIEVAFKHIGKSKYLSKINKEAYYYAETLKNYKELFADSKKSEETVKAILNKIPAFQRFMQKNSQLASLFGGGDVANGATMTGLQTRASVQNLIQDRIASGGPNAQQMVTQNIQQAQAEITNLKDKLLNPSGNVGDAGVMPNFKPNIQKSNTFLQRLEYGTNIQTQKGTRFFPVTSDIGLLLGYKLNSKSIVGIGASYKLGWGSGFNNIRITHQGIGLRSFVIYKIKGSFHLSGGYEQNYKSEFKLIDQLKEYSAWQTSGIIGISKRYQVSKKVKGDMQVLWDFLSYQQVPRAQPVVFRIGYRF